MTDFDDIAMEAAVAIRPLLQRAYDAGRIAGRQEMYEEVQNRLGSLLSPPPSDAGTANRSLEVSESQVFDSGRAPPGTVKPLIAKVLEEHPEGLTIDEVGSITGVKPNSVRGTLYALKNDGVSEKRGSRWFYVSQTKEAPQSGNSESASSQDEIDDLV